MAAREINYLGGERIYNSEKIDELLDNKQDTITVDDALSKTSTNPVQNKIIKEAVDEEIAERTRTVNELSAKVGDIGNLKTTVKTDIVSAINELSDKTGAIPDTAVNDHSTNSVENRAIYNFVKDEVLVEANNRRADSAQLTREINNETNEREAADTTLQNNINALRDASTASLNTETQERENADTTLSNAINNEEVERKAVNKLLQNNIDDLENRAVLKANLDAVPDKNKTDTAVTSKGTFDAIRFAGVKVGEVMSWPQFREETRTVTSDNPFEFDLFGKHYEKNVADENVTLFIADNVPDGWHALDGKAELNEVDYPELVEWFGGSNITVDGKIWLPYCPKTIIKIAY